MLIQSVGVGLYVSECMTGSMFVSDSVCVCVCMYAYVCDFARDWHRRCLIHRGPVLPVLKKYIITFQMC